MMIVKLPLLERARKYGYVIWRKENDFQMSQLLGEMNKLEVVINESSIGVKNIDWKNKRIPITYTITRALPESISTITLRLDSTKRLIVNFS